MSKRKSNGKQIPDFMVNQKKWTLSLGAALVGMCNLSSATGIVQYDADSSNASLGDWFLSAPSLSSSNLKNPLSTGSYQYRYGAVQFIALESGTFTFGQTYAPIDTVMLAYQGTFNPLNPNAGKLASNDDTAAATHRSIFTAAGETASSISCGANAGWCPLVSFSVQAGQSYSLVVSHYSTSKTGSFALPFSFYSNGNVSFYGFNQGSSPIDRQRSYYQSELVGLSVSPLFLGGELLIQAGQQTESHDFSLGQFNTNLINLNNNSVVFDGVFSDMSSSRLGEIGFDNGYATLEGVNTYTGATNIRQGATVSVSVDSNLGAESAILSLQGGALHVTDSISSQRDVEVRQASSLVIDTGEAYELAGDMFGDGTLTKQGQGALHLQGQANSRFTGNVDVQEGSLVLETDTALGSSAGVSVQHSASLEAKSANQQLINLDNDGTVHLTGTGAENAKLAITQTYTQTAQGKTIVDLTMGDDQPLISAQSADLAGTLEIDYFSGVSSADDIPLSSSQAERGEFLHTLIQTTDGITGEFSDVYLDGVKLSDSGTHVRYFDQQDYLSYTWEFIKDAAQHNYTLGGQFNLRWGMPADEDYAGTFTINDGQNFTLDSHALEDQVARTNWDGKSLTKLGLGTLSITETQAYTGDTVIKEGVLAWMMEDQGNPLMVVTQRLEGNYSTLAGATSAILKPSSFLSIGGDFYIAGDDCLMSDPDCFDIDNPLNIIDGVAQRGELRIVPGGGDDPEIIVDGKANIKGAYLNLQGVASRITGQALRASDLSQGDKKEFVIIHAGEGFEGSRIDGFDNANAGFANGDAPLQSVDYLAGGVSKIVDCDVSLGLANPCHYVSPNDSVNSQEYILSELTLAWNLGGKSGVDNNRTRYKNGSFTIVSGADFEVDTTLEDQDQGSDIATDGSGRLGFDSLYGWWDGKTLTKQGAGILYLTADNSYTGSTKIIEGVLSIADQSHVGGTSAIYLGQSGEHGAAGLRFEATINSPFMSNKGLNVANTITLSKDIYLGQRSDNVIDVVDADNIVYLAGSLLSAPDATSFSAASTTPMSGSSWIKSGAGTLVLASDSGSRLAYSGDVWVHQGTLELQGDLSQIVGDVYNSSTLVFNTLQDTTFTGEIDSSAPDQTILDQGMTYKRGNARLTLLGDSNTDWFVEQGTLAVANANFASHVTLAAGTALGFVESGVADSGVEPARFEGKVTADANSLIYLDRADTLNFYYRADSVFGALEVRQGVLNLIQDESQTFSMPAFTMQSVEVQNTGTLGLIGVNTYLNVTDAATFKSGSTLAVTLNPNDRSLSKLTADAISIESNASLVLKGFSIVEQLALTADTLDNVFKASALSGLNYLLLESTSPITGDFTGHANGDIVTTPEFLVYKSTYSDDRTKFYLGDFSLSWVTGGLDLGTGSFDMAESTAFNVDTPLSNQNGNFNSGWDGTSLTKTGLGLLILSSSDNTYTGVTTVEQGELLLRADNAIQHSAALNMDGGILDIYNTSQVVKQLVGSNSASTIELFDSGVLTIANQGSHGELINSSYAGNIFGNLESDSSNRLFLQQGQLSLQGSATIAAIEIASESTLVLNSSTLKHAVRSPEMILRHGALASFEGTSTFVGAIQGDAQRSTVRIADSSTWLMTTNSSIDRLDLVGGTLILGNSMSGFESGQQLNVSYWSSSANGRLILTTDLDASGQARLDSVLIAKSATGVTQVDLLDRGGFLPLLTAYRQDPTQKILLIKSLSGPGALPVNSFKGGIDFAGSYYPLVYDTSSGGFMISLTPVSVSSNYQGMQALQQTLGGGKTASAVQTLGALDFIQGQGASCSTRQAFAKTSTSRGRQTLEQDSQSDISQTSLTVGSDVYATQIGNDACAHYGFMAGVLKSSSDVEGILGGSSSPSMLGTVKADTYYAGGYAHYNLSNEKYMTMALLSFHDSLENNPIGRQRESFDATSYAATVEFGTTLNVADNWVLRPSAQWLYQSTAMDDLSTSESLIKFDKMTSNFARVGTALTYRRDDVTTFNVNAHLWRQFNAVSSTHTYSAQGSYLSSLAPLQVGKRNWADLSVGMNVLRKGMMFNVSLGYQGSFKQDASWTGHVGMKYSW